MPNKHRTPTASAMKSAARRSARSRIEQVRDEGRVKSKELENTKVVVQPTVVAPREEQSEATIADNRINDAGGVAYMEISETSRSTLDHYNWRKCMGEMKKFVKTTESECWQQTKKAFRSLSEDEPETHAALRSALDANKHPLAPFIRGGLDSWTGDHVPVVIPDPLTPLSKAARVLIEELGAAVELDGCSINMTFRSDTRDFAIFQLALDGLAPKYPGGNLHARRLRPVMPLDDRSIAAEFRIDKFHLSDNGLSIYSGDPRNADKVKMFRRNFQPGIFRFTGSGSSKELSLEQMQICDYNCGFLALPQFQFPELLSVYRELEIRGGAAVFMYQDGRSGVDNRTILEIARITKRLGEGAMAAAERQERRVLAMKKQSIGEREATCGALADPPDQMHLNDGGR